MDVQLLVAAQGLGLGVVGSGPRVGLCAGQEAYLIKIKINKK